MGYKFIENAKPKNEEQKPRSAFLSIAPEWSFEEIILSNDLRDTLEDVISFCKNKSKIIDEWELHKFLKGSGGCIGINFWGVPGTGKSIAAEALAKAMGKRVIQASYSSLIDSLQGNTEKNITALFDTAVAEDCVILFDEADGLLSKRKSGTANSDSTNIIKSHMLNLLDRSSAIVIFTTNFFKSYDRAFVRRILWNIEFKEPGYEELIKIWMLHLGNNIPKNLSYEELSCITLELSKAKNIKITGGDIKKITLMLCTQLTSGRYNLVTKEVATIVINRYLDDLQENIPHKIKEEEINDNKLSEKVKHELSD